jgi:hypothetical protein
MRLLASVLLLASCAGSAPCPQKDCASGLSVDVVTAADGAYTVAVSTDAGSGSCTFVLPLSSGEEPSCDQGDLDFFMEQRGDRVVSIEFQGDTPEELDIVVDLDGATIYDQTLAPSYQVEQPNGPDCPPTCSFAEEEITL